MKKLLVLCIISMGWFTGWAQKNDYTWAAGYSSYSGFDTSCQCWFGISRFDFSGPSVVITRDSLGINFDRSNATISDDAGNLQFYYNGVDVWNWSDVLMENGDSLGVHGTDILTFDDIRHGLRLTEISIALPSRRYNGIYDLYYSTVNDYGGGSNVGSKEVRYASLDMNANSGMGKVIIKDEVVMSHESNFSLTATRHGNGNDWWLCSNNTGTNCWTIGLQKGSSVFDTSIYCGGVGASRGDILSQKFSPDGSKLVTACTSSDVNVFNFDRCIGALDLQEHFTISDLKDSLYRWPLSIEFSPDSRFAYLFCNDRIFQLDMQANPIANSRKTVGIYQGFSDPDPVEYYQGQLAPDGKIYVNAGNSAYYVGVIDSPNGEDTACHFLDHSIHLPTFIQSVPTYPNYRLGVLAGSACDTISGLSDDLRADKERLLKVYPNPATDYTIIDYGFTDWSKGEVSLEINDELGQRVYAQKLPMYSGYQKIDVSKFAAGLYNAAIIRNNGVVGVAKFVKE